MNLNEMTIAELVAKGDQFMQIQHILEALNANGQEVYMVTGGDYIMLTKGGLPASGCSNLRDLDDVLEKLQEWYQQGVG